MADHRKETPDFFKGNELDPVDAASGNSIRSQKGVHRRTRPSTENAPGKVDERTVSLASK